MKTDTLESLLERGKSALREYKYNATDPQYQLGQAISCFTASAELSSPPVKTSSLIQLGFSYAMLAAGDRAGSAENAEQAVQIMVDALNLYKRLGNINYLLDARIHHALGYALFQRFVSSGNYEDCEKAIDAYRYSLSWTGEATPHNVRAARQYHLAQALHAYSRDVESPSQAVVSEVTELAASALRTNDSDEVSPDTQVLYSTFFHCTVIPWISRIKSQANPGYAPVMDQVSNALDPILNSLQLTFSSGHRIPFIAPPFERASLPDMNVDPSGSMLWLYKESIILGAAAWCDITCSPFTRTMGAMQLVSTLLVCSNDYRRKDMFDFSLKILSQSLSQHSGHYGRIDMRYSSKLFDIAESMFLSHIQHGHECSEMLLRLCQHIDPLLPQSHVERHRVYFFTAEALIARQEKLMTSGILNIDYISVIQNYRNALKLVPDWHPSTIDYIARLSVALDRSFDANKNQEDFDEGKMWLSVVMALRPELLGPMAPGGELYELFQSVEGRRTAEEALAAPYKSSETYPLARTYDLYVACHSVQLWGISDKMFDAHQFEDALRFNTRCLEISHYLRKRSSAEFLPPDNSMTWDMCMITLEARIATFLMSRFHLLKKLGDIPNALKSINRSIDYFDKLLKQDLPMTPNEVFYACQSSLAHFFRFISFKNPNDLDISIEKCRGAVASSISLRMKPKSTVDAVMHWVAAARLVAHESLLEAYVTLVNNLVRMAWVGWDVRTRYKNLKELPLGLVAEAVCCAITDGDVGLAVEMFESGRSILFAQALPLRSLNQELQTSHPQLFSDLARTGKQIEQLSSSFDSSFDPAQFMTSNDKMNHRNGLLRTLGEEWDGLVAKVRALPGYEDFLQTVPFHKLCLAASRGPVAIIISTKATNRSFALVITDPHIESVKLIEVPASYADLIALRTKSSQSLGRKLRGYTPDMDPTERRPGHLRKWATPEETLSIVLWELWDGVMFPIIEAIEKGTHNEDFHATGRLPHLWIIPMGILASLPLHAAGRYKAEGAVSNPQDCVSGRVVCSYAPSLSALIPKPQEEVQKPNILLLGAGEGLTCTNTEVDIVAKLCESTANVNSLVGLDVTANRVQDALRDTNIAHFACHGKQDIQNPLESILSISNSACIKVEELMKEPLPHARLAVLFACETAQGDAELTDEALHLAGTMLFAGFRGAVGTLWSMMDEDGPKMSEDFYTHLVDEKTGQISCDRAGYALHCAVKKLRESGAGLFRWVPFVHIGQ